MVSPSNEQNQETSARENGAGPDVSLAPLGQHGGRVRVHRCLAEKALTQRSQYPLITEHTLNYNRIPNML